MEKRCPLKNCGRDDRNMLALRSLNSHRYLTMTFGSLFSWNPSKSNPVLAGRIKKKHPGHDALVPAHLKNMEPGTSTLATRICYGRFIRASVRVLSAVQRTPTLIRPPVEFHRNSWRLSVGIATNRNLKSTELCQSRRFGSGQSIPFGIQRRFP